VLSCQAINTVLTEPREVSLVLDIHCEYNASFIVIHILVSVVTCED
jgi:hypothetical protein